MGVIYHRRQPLQHLACLKAVMRPQAELVLETLIVTDEDRYPRALSLKTDMQDAQCLVRAYPLPNPALA